MNGLMDGMDIQILKCACIKYIHISFAVVNKKLWEDMLRMYSLSR
jgi:hypothetical protein